jgi:hypothetical protein
MIGMKVVEFYNVAVGATNLDFGTALIKFHLYPESLLPDGPDVIISAYATNEQASHVTDTTTKEWIDEEQQRVEAFIHASQTSTHACKTPPLVLFVDDYLGNRQDYINREMSYSNIVTHLADWYGNIMHVSYADAVRKYVYADTNESVFSPPWPIDDTTNIPRTNVHFEMTGHVSTCWIILYSLIHSSMVWIL